MNYTEAAAKLTGRCSESRKIGNHTYLKRRSRGANRGAIAVLFHRTDILTFHDDGRIHVNTGGWQSITTRARMNEFLPKGWAVWSESGYMFIGSNWNHAVAAFDGTSVTIEKDGTVTGGSSVEEQRRHIKDMKNELRRPVNRGRYWLAKATGLTRDSSKCSSRWCRCHGGRRGWRRRAEVGACEHCNCVVTYKQPSLGKLTIQQILEETNQTVRTAQISIYGIDRFFLDAGATVLEAKNGYELLELKFSGSWVERMKALKMNCVSTGAAYLNTVPPGITTVDQGLRFMFGLPDGVDYFEVVGQQS